MSTDSTSPSLLERVRDSADEAAWRRFDARYGPLVLDYCRARGLKLHDAEDVRQVVMLSLARGLATFAYDRQRGRFRDYLACIVRNAIARSARRHAARPAVLSNDALEALAPRQASPAEEALWEREWTRHHCLRALEALRASESPRNMAILDRLLAGAAAAVVAREFDLEPPAVRKIKERLRQRLAELIAAQLADEDRADADP